MTKENDMFFKKKNETPAVDAGQIEGGIRLDRDEIEGVSGGIKWGDGDRPTLQDATDRKKKKTFKSDPDIEIR